MNRPAMQCHYCKGNMKKDKVSCRVNRLRHSRTKVLNIEAHYTLDIT